MVVRKPHRGGDYPLKASDVIASIGGREIDNRGLVRIRSGLRLDFRSLVQSSERDGLVELGDHPRRPAAKTSGFRSERDIGV